MLCSVVKHAGSGRARKKCRGKHETQSSVFPHFKVALFTHKILNGSTNISVIFHRTLTRASEIHTHNTRFAAKLNFHRPKPNNNYGTSTFAFVSSKLWETILTNVKRLPYTSFLNQYKLYLLNTQSSV